MSKAKRPRKVYDEKFRASALLLLEASGYPDKVHGLARTSKSVGVPVSTLRGWWNGSRNPVPADVRTIKRVELVDMLRSELDGILGDMPNARQDASYRDLGTVAGILFDKLQLLTAQPTERTDSVIRVITDAGSPNTFAVPTPWTANGHQQSKAVQHPGDGEKVGQNGTRPKVSD